jgi:hypothetical protein
MRKSLVFLALPAALHLTGCAYDGAPAATDLAPLAQDPRQPALALLEHVLTGHFAEAGAAAPTTCASLAPTALTDEQEEALIVRLVRLAPGARCVERDGTTIDAITGDRAQRVQVYQFACTTSTLCHAWVARPGRAPVRHSVRFEAGRWSFDNDAAASAR